MASKNQDDGHTSVNKIKPMPIDFGNDCYLLMCKWRNQHKVKKLIVDKIVEGMLKLQELEHLPHVQQIIKEFGNFPNEEEPN